jgi:hypothetical protein
MKSIFITGAAAVGCLAVWAFNQVSPPQEPDTQVAMMQAAAMSPGLTMTQMREQMNLPSPCDFPASERPPGCPVQATNHKGMDQKQFEELKQIFASSSDGATAQVQEPMGMPVSKDPCDDFPAGWRAPDCSLIVK